MKEVILALKGENNDTLLDHIIDTILHQEISVKLSSLPLLHRFFLENKNEEEEKEGIKTALDNISENAYKLAEILQLASKRIEVLSIGDDSK
ncbi:MAG: hypothetical protein ACYDG5_03740 [Dehalococcoidales bacterium]